MLKVFLGFLVSVVVLLSSAYVPWASSRTYATSANIVLSQIQAGGAGAATQEFIVLYNNSPDAVDITGWCLKNKNNAAITCFDEPLSQKLYIPAYMHAVVVSTSFASVAPSTVATKVYVPISQSSGSITGGSDTILLIDQTGALVDQQSWTTSISGGVQFERHGSGSPIIYQDTDTSTDWSITLPGVLPLDETQVQSVVVDFCSNIDGVQVEVPFGMELNAAGECVAQVVTKLDITEILPNAAGSDVGHEFIELYNPNDDEVSLSEYQLYIGPQFDDIYDFPVDMFIGPHSYKSFTNTDIPFTLSNTSSQVLLTLKNGTAVSEVPMYVDPKDDESWALIDDVWQYTNIPTPGLVNLVSKQATIKAAPVTPTPQSCAANQYRSPDTNRCRLIETTVAKVTPCKDGQYRSEETNRCRNIASDVKIVAPCSEGEERNPDTNRCRTVTKMPNADYAVLGAQTGSNGNWYVWAAVGGVLLLALAYAVWEWHAEIQRFFSRFAVRVLRFARMRK